MSPAYHAYLTSYLPVLTVLVAGVALVAAMLTANRLLRPVVPTRQKTLTYECGVDPVGSDWAQVHIRFYVFAYLYVVFAVDSVFLFPWATVFERLGGVSIGEMAVFVAVVVAGLGYAGRTGVLTWS
ncbi:MAG: NADH-quinone oxidoreductase subunit [Nocardioidaceae bacterium]|jgi:NADH-quinone oxidoreductase subunit A|nr:NADH-quinone oxidoreductase subunit [Nocardioidaceae bacterium]MDX6307554.1 NADH-quinone oxidoreductase subunit [Nocardioidaceae bacterium]